mmetsp:Transcript_87784/g.253487  ORF Transcript_87784/g.253487 Transcript_87784/m.253487 type:complete len:280 (+) Transcript_87784:1159-1998(+)
MPRLRSFSWSSPSRKTPRELATFSSSSASTLKTMYASPGLHSSGNCSKTSAPNMTTRTVRRFSRDAFKAARAVEVNLRPGEAAEIAPFHRCLTTVCNALPGVSEPRASNTSLLRLSISATGEALDAELDFSPDWSEVLVFEVFSSCLRFFSTDNASMTAVSKRDWGACVACCLDMLIAIFHLLNGEPTGEAGARPSLTCKVGVGGCNLLLSEAFDFVVPGVLSPLLLDGVGPSTERPKPRLNEGVLVTGLGGALADAPGNTTRWRVSTATANSSKRRHS